MSKLLVYHNPNGERLGSLPVGTVFKFDGEYYIKIDKDKDADRSDEALLPVVNLISCWLKFMHKDKITMPVLSAKLNIT